MLQYEEAATCYDRSLCLLNTGGLLAALLLNTAACHTALGQHAAALHAAAAVTAVDRGSAKAAFRTALALDGLGLSPEAVVSCREVGLLGMV